MGPWDWTISLGSLWRCIAATCRLADLQVSRRTARECPWLSGCSCGRACNGHGPMVERRLSEAIGGAQRDCGMRRKRCQAWGPSRRHQVSSEVLPLPITGGGRNWVSGSSGAGVVCVSAAPSSSLPAVVLSLLSARLMMSFRSGPGLDVRPGRAAARAAPVSGCRARSCVRTAGRRGRPSSPGRSGPGRRPAAKGSRESGGSRGWSATDTGHG